MAVRAVAPQTQERALSGLNLHPRYEVLAVLGAGSYGTVVGCYDREAQRHVAIKRCRSLFEDLIDCKRVLRELAIQRRLDHRNVARIHSAFLPDGISAFSEVYIVMERCHTDLHKLIGSVVSMEYRHISVMIYGLLAGLHYLHSAGIYHRDLKPANCLVDHNCEVKICDFGLSKALAEEDDADWADDGDVDDVPLCPPQPVLRRELTTHVVTRWYRAPEVILLFQEYTGAIDMWSAGCILAELLQTLQVPYDRRHPLFPGSSCFPLSPRGNEKGEPKDEDQLTQIFNVLGTPSCDEAWLQHARRYVALFGRRPGSGLAAALPFAAPEWLSLLEGMLRVDPSKRLTVHQALQHGVFRGRRDAARERPAGGCVALKFEAEPQLSEQRLRLLFNEEILEIGRRGGA